MQVRREIFEIIVFALLAAAGGIAKFLSSRLDATAHPLGLQKFIFLFCANAFVSGFSGTMGALLMEQITHEQTLHHAAAGLFGFMGARGLEILSIKLSNKL